MLVWSTKYASAMEFVLYTLRQSKRAYDVYFPDVLFKTGAVPVPVPLLVVCFVAYVAV